ncbi:hypothetical protein TOC8172_00120 [Pseudomonas syringae]
MSDLIYAPPKASLDKDESGSGGPEFYVVSLQKFFILYFLTSGFFRDLLVLSKLVAEQEVFGQQCVACCARDLCRYLRFSTVSYGG